jgi:hypothetical protein
VGDHPDADAEEMEDRAHPLRVAPGEVVVDGHDVDARGPTSIQDGRQRARRGSCPRRSASRDLALVEDGGALELDVEVAHPERSASSPRGSSRSLGQDVVERLLEPGVLALAGARPSARAGARGRGGGARRRTARRARRPRGPRPELGEVARISSSERASYSASSAFVSSTIGWRRRISRSFESTNQFRKRIWHQV